MGIGLAASVKRFVNLPHYLWGQGSACEMPVGQSVGLAAVRHSMSAITQLHLCKTPGEAGLWQTEEGWRTDLQFNLNEALEEAVSQLGPC